MSNLIIAIDGFSSTGKSTFAKLISRKMGIPYLDSGAMYRCVTLHSLENSIINPESHDIDMPRLEAALAGDITISWVPNADTGLFDICLNGRNVEQRIRMLDVSDNVSPIATVPAVRDFVDAILHERGSQGCVMDGRDIGTAVFPEADIKIYMVADAAIRAQRRLDEMKAKGQEATFEEVLKNVEERDYIDSHREMNPLRKAEDAIELDNSHMTIDEQMIWFDGVLKGRFGDAVYASES
ncbi:MAG: (d)CMP kinase [Bacteroidales bacterium]|nr:(d)CMP kinase [Bacteroidales bacterium]